ncbi:uncharacterized protein C1orf109 homolog isoform X1 [Pipistrellus kuhlii]|uniref:uncharacterized protein C1orf109 homolog isoform X1 n=1 Tax=Pipistrellus kuhlii TaxID=59472 RepID=UPI001E26FA4C|nr:uncharacterized protein C1orf109 homolog isoform X1 [Pipistrellus kuhlii]
MRRRGLRRRVHDTQSQRSSCVGRRLTGRTTIPRKHCGTTAYFRDFTAWGLRSEDLRVQASGSLASSKLDGLLKRLRFPAGLREATSRLKDKRQDSGSTTGLFLGRPGWGPGNPQSAAPAALLKVRDAVSSHVGQVLQVYEQHADAIGIDAVLQASAASPSVADMLEWLQDIERHYRSSYLKRKYLLSSIRWEDLASIQALPAAWDRISEDEHPDLVPDILLTVSFFLEE